VTGGAATKSEFFAQLSHPLRRLKVTYLNRPSAGNFRGKWIFFIPGKDLRAIAIGCFVTFVELLRIPHHGTRFAEFQAG
jgi:hypothetical protein